MVNFAGWDMPLRYRGIIPEHEQTRQAASIFDVSHMGRLRISGRDALPFLNGLLTRDISKAHIGQSMYSLTCNEVGGVLDDLIVSRFDKNYLVVCNAGNRETMMQWFQSHVDGAAVAIEDETFKTAMVALQGPRVVELLNSVLPEPISDLKRYHFVTQRYMFLVQYTIFRSGYTGEDGVEIILSNSAAQMALNMLVSRDANEADSPIRPAGLGARDTLRLEAGMPLYGHELSTSVDPISAGLSWAVNFDKEFIGRAALEKIAREGPAHKLIGLTIEGPRQARQGAELFRDGRHSGMVTSGTASPTLKCNIAMAYVCAADAEPGTALEVDLRGERVGAVVTKLPFYRRGA